MLTQGDTIRLVRETYNIVGNRLAKYLGFSRNYLSRVENNHDPISDEQFRKILEGIYYLAAEKQKKEGSVKK